MKHRSFMTASLLLAFLAFAATPASAQDRTRSAPRRGPRVTGQAVPRVGPPPRAARPTYRPYIYASRPGLRVGVYSGYYGYPYSNYGRGFRGPYGAVRIKDAPRDSQVLVDGYYVGIADDFDGLLQQLTLEGGAHKIEIHTPNGPTLTFDVNVLPGQTITYRAAVRP